MAGKAARHIKSVERLKILAPDENSVLWMSSGRSVYECRIVKIAGNRVKLRYRNSPEHDWRDTEFSKLQLSLAGADKGLKLWVFKAAAEEYVNGGPVV